MNDKKNWLPPKDYKEKISNLLNSVSSSVPKRAEPVVPKELTLYDKIKPLGIKNGLVDLFKMDESYDIPRFVTEQSEEDTGNYVKVNPPSSYPDCDEYWNSIKGHLNHIGQPLKYVAVQGGLLQTKVNDDSGKDQILEIKLLRDTDNSDKPAIGLSFQGSDPIKPEEVSRYLGSVGFKFDRLGIKSVNNMLVVDLII